jgi:glucose/mannose transport system permease protein
VRFFFNILLPTSFAGIISAAVLTFTNIWNEFIIALSLSRDPTTRLAIPMLAGLKGSYVAQWNTLMAGASIVSIPGLLVLIFLGRFFISGLVEGAIKE